MMWVREIETERQNRLIYNRKVSLGHYVIDRELDQCVEIINSVICSVLTCLEGAKFE